MLKKGSFAFGELQEMMGGPRQRGTRMAGMTQPWSRARLGLEQAANIPDLLQKHLTAP